MTHTNHVRGASNVLPPSFHRQHNRTSHVRRLFWVVVLFLFLPLLKAEAGTLHGRVTDTHSQPLAGVTVRLVNTQFGAITNPKGEYHIDHVPGGSYNVEAKVVGFRTERRNGLQIVEDGVSEFDLALTEKPVTASEIVVEANADHASDISARLSEKNAPNVINVVSAESIEHSPDRTSADVLQRVSGLSLQRDQGEGRYVVFRGMDQRYNNTLINGIKIPSPEPKVRFVPLDIIPSELLSHIEITKALTPDMEGDAIGGTANLVLRDAPDGLLLNAAAASGYSQYLFDTKFTTWDNNTLAPDPAATHGPGYSAQPSDFTRGGLNYSSKQAPVDRFLNLTLGDRFFDNTLGLVFSGSLQNTYRHSEGLVNILRDDINNVQNNVIMPRYQETEPRTYSLQRARTGLYGKADYVIAEKQSLEFSYTYARLDDIEQRHSVNELLDGSHSRATYYIGERSRYQQQNITSLLLDGSHALTDALSLKWAGSYSDASREQPDDTQLTLETGNLAGQSAFREMTRRWQHNDDRDYFGKMDLELAPIGSAFGFKAGGLVRKKTRNNYENDYTLNPDTAQGVQSQRWRGIDSASWTVYNNFGTNLYGVNNYDASERVIASYVQSTWTIDRLHILAGVRFESTEQGYVTQAPITVNGNSATITYTDVLPSIHFTYQLTDEQNIRLSVTKSLSRPSYFELVPYQIQHDQYTEMGNFQLRRTQSTNVDLRYEFYPNLVEVLTAGVFYKNIVDPIELGFDGSNPASNVIKPVNLGNAQNFGFEFVAAKRLGDFLASANYTFTNSTVTSPKINRLRYGSGDPVIQITQETRPLVGQSAHILNVALAFDHQESGTFIEITYGLTGRRLVLVSPFAGYDNYQNALHELDLSYEQKLMDKLVTFGKLSNLLNSPYEVALPNGMLMERETYKPSFEVGFRYKL